MSKRTPARTDQSAFLLYVWDSFMQILRASLLLWWCGELAVMHFFAIAHAPYFCPSNHRRRYFQSLGCRCPATLSNVCFKPVLPWLLIIHISWYSFGRKYCRWRWYSGRNFDIGCRCYGVSWWVLYSREVVVSYDDIRWRSGGSDTVLVLYSINITPLTSETNNNNPAGHHGAHDIRTRNVEAPRQTTTRATGDWEGSRVNRLPSLADSDSLPYVRTMCTEILRWETMMFVFIYLLPSIVADWICIKMGDDSTDGWVTCGFFKYWIWC